MGKHLQISQYPPNQINEVQRAKIKIKIIKKRL